LHGSDVHDGYEADDLVAYLERNVGIANPHLPTLWDTIKSFKANQGKKGTDLDE